MATIEDQVSEYARIYPAYTSFTAKLRTLLEDLMRDSEIPYQIVEGRPKSIDDFKEKLQRPNKLYADGLKELPDLCGCRIITYYWDDCERVASILKNEFIILEEELAHQPEALEADKFGYLSAHYVLKLAENRENLPEWKAFADFRAEIQVRTLIQHAWSAVSHALQYKSETEIASRLQRRLYRIAGLFELADEEFASIRNERRSMRQEASKALTEGNTLIALSVASVEEFIRAWPKIAFLEQAAENAGFQISDDVDLEYAGRISELSVRLKILNIKDLEIKLSKQDFSVLDKIFNGRDDYETWTAPTSFLVYLLLIASSINKISISHLIKAGWNESMAAALIKALKS